MPTSQKAKYTINTLYPTPATTTYNKSLRLQDPKAGRRLE